MGPYCKFCNQRCFVRMPTWAPTHIARAYRRKVGLLPLMATCKKGQEYEKATVGHCYDDVKREETNGE